jgi:type II secretory pathway predicted ATPase ExeA
LSKTILDHFNLKDAPFGDTPDPRFLYFGPQHREALASLIVGTESNRGFLAVIARPGMGKTSLLYQYLEKMRHTARTAFIFQTDCDSREFLRHILMDLSIDASGQDLPAMHETLNRILADEARAGRRFILVIDEAQNLDDRTLESVRLLSNFETPWAKLMQIVLVGQPQLAKHLARPSMLQFRQRLSMVIRLDPFNYEETRNYINHRLWAAGYAGQSLFTISARRLIAERSQGIPRNINTICFNAMALACGTKQSVIDHNIILEVLADLDLDSLRDEAAPSPARELKRMLSQTARPAKGPSRWGKVLAKIAAAGVLLVCLLGYPFTLNRHEVPAPEAAALNREVAVPSPALVEPRETQVDPRVPKAIPVDLHKEAGKP